MTKQSIINKRLADKRRAAGLCVRCGQERLVTRSLGEHCRRLMNQTARRRREGMLTTAAGDDRYKPRLDGNYIYCW